jgi:hypothetical protein
MSPRERHQDEADGRADQEQKRLKKTVRRAAKRNREVPTTTSSKGSP